ncbi:MAG TPA: 23S rRNA (guanosine(2251)-2'-O)-methyltransferase RlmB [Pyrinomonadaceae bacterium]|nr:23S rRNA (guanosine(2251)-2'-O)-methyltransferase RlmB [Pyrinomonadaceae bacterium]
MPSNRKNQPSSHDRTTEIFGVNPVIEALRARRRQLQEITIASGAKDGRLRELIELARAQGVPVHQAPRVTLDKRAGNGTHQGVVARVAAAHYIDADDLIETIAERVGMNPEPLALVLDGIEDPHNLGAILRTAECARVDGVFVPERRAVGLTETVAKASAGALEHVQVARATNLSRLIDKLKERNVWVVGTAAEAQSDYTQWDWTRASAIVMGGEGSGLHRLVREHCDAVVRIPVLGQIESLNVSVATGVILYEALRQRSANTGKT